MIPLDIQKTIIRHIYVTNKMCWPSKFLDLSILDPFEFGYLNNKMYQKRHEL